MKIIFLIDTSISMNRSFNCGFSYLDAAKIGVEHYFSRLKQLEQKQKDSLNSYALVTYDEPPFCIKSHFQHSEKQFMNALKFLKAIDLSTPGRSFACIFDYINSLRFSNDIDTVGSGRFIGDADTTMFFWFTDGGMFFDASKSILSDRIDIPGLRSPGAELFNEPFRWDQRLYTILLKPDYSKSPINNYIKLLSEVMWGSCWTISSVSGIRQCIDNCIGAAKPFHNVLPQMAVSHVSGAIVTFEEGCLY